ncbi:hypothetical protein HWV62_38018 [Athelia sp. TMB]|nr:hypothetical protein HWV62_38018 [Athelia sp. TMB]
MSLPLDAHAQSSSVPAPDTSTLNNTESDAPGEHRGSSMAYTLFSENLRSKISYGTISHIKRALDEEGAVGMGGDAGGTPERPQIPSALEYKSEPPTTPLPKLPMVVLSIAMLGEFLSANVPTPFLLFMVKGFGEAEDEAAVASWTGVLVAAFFLTQFATSLLWATISQRYGQRIVLFISLLGSAVTVAAFGTCSSLAGAITVRLLQGIFAGAVGVARGGVVVVTDTSNEGRAYAILGLKWPETFGNIPFFVEQPYILPCAIAAAVTFTGSILSLFLGRDGGPRERSVHLQPEKSDNDPLVIPDDSLPTSPAAIAEEQEPQGAAGLLRKKISKRSSGYLPARGADNFDTASQHSMPSASAAPRPSVPFTYTYSRTSRTDGSAYGRPRSYRPQSNVDTASLNFGERLLMANENAVTNIADLWVAAAISANNEDPFESESEDGSEMEFDSHVEAQDVEGIPASMPTVSRPGSRLGREAHRPLTQASFPARLNSRPSPSPHPRPHSAVRAAAHSPSVRHASSIYLEAGPSSRRGSNSSTIFAHSGVRPSLLFQDIRQVGSRPNDSADALAPIIEGRRLSDSQIWTSSAEQVPSLASQLPILVIVQYGLLGLHSTTHDQVFLSYLVSEYDNGGLNLNAGHFAQLVALMCFAQIFFQFYLYPNIGPPRGRFSHLSMFRIGSLLFVPAYLTVTLYRVFASEEEDGNAFLMTDTFPSIGD